MQEPDKGGGGVGSGLIGLYLESVLMGELFTIYRDWQSIRIYIKG